MALASRALLLSRLSPLPAAAFRLLRPLAAAGTLLPAAVTRLTPIRVAARGAVRCFATQPATTSLRDSSSNWSNRPPKETILLDGCDFEHWLVVMEPPPGDASNPDVPREEIIDSYIKTLAQVVGSEQDARQKIYSVSTRHYFAFGALVSEELSNKLKELPKVRWVLPDSYLDVKNKDYGGEPFVNGEAVPYDPKYHEEWVRNNARANERSRRNDRPRNFDRSRNFERRESTQNFQNRGAPSGQGLNSPPPGQNPANMPPPPPPPGQHRSNIPPSPQRHNTGAPQNYQPHMPNPQAGYPQGGAPPYQQGASGYTHGGAPPYQQGGASGYQGGPPGYQGRNQGGPTPGYQGANQGGPTPGYQGSNQGYPGGNLYNGQGGNTAPYHGGGDPSYNGGAPGYNQLRGQGGNPNYQ